MWNLKQLLLCISAVYRSFLYTKINGNSMDTKTEWMTRCTQSNAQTMQQLYNICSPKLFRVYHHDVDTELKAVSEKKIKVFWANCPLKIFFKAKKSCLYQKTAKSRFNHHYLWLTWPWLVPLKLEVIYYNVHSW